MSGTVRGVGESGECVHLSLDSASPLGEEVDSMTRVQISGVLVGSGDAKRRKIKRVRK